MPLHRRFARLLRWRIVIPRLRCCAVGASSVATGQYAPPRPPTTSSDAAPASVVASCAAVCPLLDRIQPAREQLPIARSRWARHSQLPMWRERIRSAPIRSLLADFSRLSSPPARQLPVQILVLQPGFTAAILGDARTPYLKPFFHDSWEPARGRSNVTIRAIPNAAVNIWLDQPELFRTELSQFAKKR